MNQYLTEQMHGHARLQVALAKMEGRKIDKAACRFNDIVECALRYGRCGDVFSYMAAWAGMRDAIDACIVGDPMHVPGASVLSIVPDWMLRCGSECQH